MNTEEKLNMIKETLDIVANKEEKAKPKRERKEYMKKYYQDHKEDLLRRSNKRYTPKKNKNIENIENEKID